MKIDMISQGVNDQKIFVTGIPVSERFLQHFDKNEICKEFELSPEKDTILFFAGGEFGLGRNTTYMILKILIRLFKDLQIIAISGKNKKMNLKFKTLIENTNSKNRVKLLEYTNKVPELMFISDGVITKAGGLTLTESLVSNLPIAIINPIPGQEEENAEYIVSNGAAVWIKKDASILRILKYLSRNRDYLKNMKQKSKELAKPNSTSDICEILIKKISE